MAATDIAVVGMACRLPGATDLDAFWRLLHEGRDARRELTDELLRGLGVPEDLLADPAFVKAAMVLDDIDRFDAGFFGMSPRDAALFDPQHRVWLEVCWQAFEHAGHVPERFDGRIGVFAGSGMDTYLLHNILSNPDLVRQVGMFLIRHTGNDKDFLATRTSYQFDLRGPSINVQTACSTSLVAIHSAAQSLLAGECDMALAGGVTIMVPQDQGYLYRAGEVLSPDGHCRAFDADSRGTIFGSGAGVVVLRRLQDALDDGDTIHAVVAGSAVNNDGSRKVSFLAPSVDGYAEVVAEALAIAGVSAEQVQYLEAHGTGTAVGDPIEVEALTQAFRATTDRRGFCGIGSVKTNIGHLDTAAGVAGLLKVVLAMQHGEMPASLNYRRPNPLIDFMQSPFHVVAAATPWPRNQHETRLAGVSSLGVGGTNAHVVVREGVALEHATPTPYPRRCHLLPISGKCGAAAVANAAAIGNWLEQHAHADLGPVAWTLQHGRRAFDQRGFAVGADGAELAGVLRSEGFCAQLKQAPQKRPSIVFLFGGGGSQYPGMARELYEHEPAFRAAADACLAALPEANRGVVRALLFEHDREHDEQSAIEMQRPSRLLPTLFVVEYALARTLQSFGIEADAMLGHSLGEYVAATLGGTWSLDQVMPVLVLRGECLEQAPAGAVLSVSLSPAEIQAMGDADLSLSAANAPGLCAVAGSPAAIERLERTLRRRDVDHQRLRIGVAAHSHLLDPVLDRFRRGLRRFTLRPATRPWISNVTGDWIDAERAADADYWVEHLRRTVRFEQGIATLLADGDRVFVEIGPGKALTSLVRLHARARTSPSLVSLPHPQDGTPADAFLLTAVGRLWQLGVAIDWRAFQGGVGRGRVPLPTYAFQRQRHWIDAGAKSVVPDAAAATGMQPPARLPESQWMRQPVWTAAELDESIEPVADAHWLCVGDNPFVAAFAEHVRQAGGTAAVVSAADSASQQALESAGAPDGQPARLLFALPLDERDGLALVQALLAMCQALARVGAMDDLRLVALTIDAVTVAGEPVRRHASAGVAGFLRVVPREFPGVRTCCIDLDARSLDRPEELVHALRREVECGVAAPAIARHGGLRYAQSLAAVATDGAAGPAWRPRGSYLITGGLGGIGMLLAEHLAHTVQARLALVSRRGLPPRAVWDEWLRLRGDDATAGLIRRVRAMEQQGAEVEVFAADVVDRTAMQRVVQTCEQRFGALHGVVHAAGVLDDGPIQTRGSNQVERLWLPKVVGAAILDEVTAHRSLDLFVLCASTSGLAGIPGQCDYAAANSALDAFAHWRSCVRAGRSLAVDWGLWRDVGMLAKASASEPPPPPTWLGERSQAGDVVEFAATWSPATHWQLGEHRMHGGDCVMPGTGHLELMAAAVQAVTGRSQVTLEGVELQAPLAFPDDAARVVIVRVQQGDRLTVTISSAGADGARHERTEHARAMAHHGAAGEQLLAVASCRTATASAARVVTEHQRGVDFGPRWQCVERIGVGERQVLGELRLAERFVDDLAEHPLHAALLDMAFGCGIRLLAGSESETLFVPVGCEVMCVHGRLPAVVVSHVRLRSQDQHARLAVFDVTVATPAGVVLIELQGLTLFGVRGAFAATRADAGGAAKASPNGHDANGHGGNGHGAPDRAVNGQRAATNGRVPVHRSRPASRIAAILPRGFTGPEAMLGLERALATGLSQAVLSTLDVAQTADWLSLPPERVATIGPAVPAAVAADAAVADAAGPRDDVERKLAAAFETLLGVDQPGIDADFFELGGHSLLAVRLFARLHQEFGLDLELATLLAAGSVRKLAAVVRRELQLPEPGDAPAPAVAPRRGQHVVPIQTEGSRPLLFLVHGAGGNVLGFRELSHYLGKDQPLYGLQARGVDGKQPPHATIAEMARAYLDELRELQPTGPYFLGGYSGGGVVAFEMAQLLRSAGEEVAFVGLIDSWCPQMPQRGRVARALLHVGRLAQKGPMYPIDILRTKYQRWSAARDTERAREQGGVLPQEKRGFEVQFAFERAFVQHRVQPYEGKVWLFRADDQQQGSRYIVDETLGWGPFVEGGLVIERCPGNHFTMCAEPNVQVLCRGMMAAISLQLSSSTP